MIIWLTLSHVTVVHEHICWCQEPGQEPNLSKSGWGGRDGKEYWQDHGGGFGRIRGKLVGFRRLGVVCLGWEGQEVKIILVRVQGKGVEVGRV